MAAPRHQMIELSGYKPDFDVEIQITGIRPVEKLYEELRHTEETHEPTEHPRIFKLRNDRALKTPPPVMLSFRRLPRQAALSRSSRRCAALCPNTPRLLIDAPPGRKGVNL